MSLFKYESELYPVGPEEHDYDWWKAHLLSLPTDELKKVYKEKLEVLDKLRMEEPAKKRGKKDEYRSWVRKTHDLLDLINEIKEELQLRQNN